AGRSYDPRAEPVCPDQDEGVEPPEVGPEERGDDAAAQRPGERDRQQVVEAEEWRERDEGADGEAEGDAGRRARQAPHTIDDVFRGPPPAGARPDEIADALPETELVATAEH